MVGILVLAPLVFEGLDADLPVVVRRLDWGRRLEAAGLLLSDPGSPCVRRADVR